MLRPYILAGTDDALTAKLLTMTLSEQGWQVVTVTSGLEALQVIENDLPDLVIIDIMMPDIAGCEICLLIRERSRVPTIVLSAEKELTTKVKCLDLGADDYITKPFAVTELIARIKVALRRNAIYDDTLTMPSYVSGELSCDFVHRHVTLDGKEVRLTPIEYQLLQELILNSGKVLTHSHLLSKVWGPEYKVEREYLHTYVKHLRAKIESDPKKPRRIVCVPGVGYRFTDIP